MSEIKYPTINGVITADRRAEEQRKVGEAVRLRIKSDGTFWGTRVLAVHEDGSECPVHLCDRIEISITAGGARATIHVPQVELDVQAEPGGAGPTVDVRIHVGANTSADAVRDALVGALQSAGVPPADAS